jgi:hypothetical protein
MKSFSDTIENRTFDLSACSAVPQPTALPRAPYFTNLYDISVSLMCVLSTQLKEI